MIFIYCLYAFINDLLLIDIFNIQIPKSVTFILFSIFTLVEYYIFSLTLHKILKKQRFKNLILFAAPIFLIICVYQFYLDILKSEIDSISITIEYIFIIAFCLIYFFEELNEPNTTFIYSSYKFWVVLGILIYFTGTFFFFMQTSFFSVEQWGRWSPINYIFNVFKNVFFSIALVIRNNTQLDNSFKNPYDELFQKRITPL